MTQGQLDIANKHKDFMTEKYKFSKPNVEFKLGKIENIDLPDNSVDVVISNCVLNLVPEKKTAFEEVWRVLKPGG